MTAPMTSSASQSKRPPGCGRSARRGSLVALADNEGRGGGAAVRHALTFPQAGGRRDHAIHMLDAVSVSTGPVCRSGGDRAEGGSHAGQDQVGSVQLCPDDPDDDEPQGPQQVLALLLRSERPPAV